jgi:guanylate kinase
MAQLIGDRQGLIFVLSAPAGTGKTTLVQMLRQEFSHVVESISCTTRLKRAEEIEGKHYHFLSQEEFARRLRANEFLEHTRYMDHLYGTSRAFVAQQQSRGHHVFLVIDTQGALELKKKIEAIYIFLSAPSLEELRRRLELRKTESPEVIDKRIRWAEHELAQISHYDYHIVNDDLKTAYGVLRAIVIAEGHRIERRSPR